MTDDKQPELTEAKREPRSHDLKCWPPQFDALMDGTKTHEVRVDDRGYQVGDLLVLHEWDPNGKEYSGREIRRVVSHVTSGGSFGLPPGLVVMSVKPDIEHGPRLSDAELLGSVDAAVWAREFCKTWRQVVHPDQPCPDEGWMIAWFANAMMAMHDHVEPKHEQQDSSAPTSGDAEMARKCLDAGRAARRLTPIEDKVWDSQVSGWATAMFIEARRLLEVDALRAENTRISDHLARLLARIDDFERLHQADQERIAYLEHELAILPAPRPRIVCLCGSTRFYQQFKEANYRETMAGKIVLSVGFYPHAQVQEHGQHLGVTAEQKVALDELHKRKIDLADEVLVLDVGGYIGESTKSEIEHAKRAGKPIRYLSAQSAPSGALRAEQAIGVALSVVMCKTEMGECQELAPGFLRHLAAMGWTLAPVQEQTAAQALAKVTLAIGSQRLAIQEDFIKAFVEETGAKIADCVLKEEIKDGKISWWLEHRPTPKAQPPEVYVGLDLGNKALDNVAIGVSIGERHPSAPAEPLTASAPNVRLPGEKE
jgi:hypothetical protein